MIELVLHYRRTSRFGLNAVHGAVETDPRTRAVPVLVARGLEAAVAAARRALAGGRRPVVAWSFLTASLEEVRGELAAFRAACPGRPVVHLAGGAHPSADPEGTLRAGFDLVARGEGERTLPALLAALDRAANDGAAADRSAARSVPGLAWLEPGPEGTPRLATSGRAEPVDLDAVPPWAAGGRAGPIEITRGCIWACRFCQTPFLFKARWRHRSVSSVRAAVADLRARGARDVRFVTPSALSYGAEGDEPNLEAVEALLAAAREAIGPAGRIFLGTFPSELRPEHVSAEVLALLRRHCHNRLIILGGQSGSDRLLAAMGRGHDAAAVERAAALTVEAGLTPAVDLMFGLPDEAEEDREATRRLARHLAAMGARVAAHAFMPLPGTPWAGAPSARIDETTRLLLDRLASAGRSHGPWRRQAGQAP